MILIVVVRRAVCETCHGWFDLTPDEKPPEVCRLCGSPHWEWGQTAKDQIYIQTGKSKRGKRLNPGARSRARQQQGRKQWQGFKPKPEEPCDSAQ